SPEPSQPPTALPASPSRIATAAAVAPAVAAFAAFGSTGAPGWEGTAGDGARPAYHPLKTAPPKLAMASRTTVATRNAMAACRIAGSARRIPAIRAVTHPPITNARNEAKTAYATAVRPIPLKSVTRPSAPAFHEPTAVP